jgi:repressor LexA
MTDDVKEIFAANVFRLRKERGLTQLEFGDKIGLGKTTVSQWESAQKLPNAGSIEKIASFFNIPKSALFAEGNDRFITYDRILNLPVVGKISCGNGSFTYEEIEDYEPTPEAWVRGGEYFYLRAEGDSMMNARILDGDLVLIRRQEVVEDGEIGAVVVNGKTYLKRIHIKNDAIVLNSENQKYSPLVFGPEDNVRVIGKLRKVIISL